MSLSGSTGRFRVCRWGCCCWNGHGGGASTAGVAAATGALDLAARETEDAGLEDDRPSLIIEGEGRGATRPRNEDAPRCIRPLHAEEEGLADETSAFLSRPGLVDAVAVWSSALVGRARFLVVGVGESDGSRKSRDDDAPICRCVSAPRVRLREEERSTRRSKDFLRCCSWPEGLGPLADRLPRSLLAAAAAGIANPRRPTFFADKRSPGAGSFRNESRIGKGL